MDYRPFIYGGLASMTAEFGEIICLIPLTVTKTREGLGFDLAPGAFLVAQGRGAVISFGTSDCGTVIQ